MLIARAANRRWSPYAIAALGLILVVPLLGSFGFWDPHEVRVADLAKEWVGDASDAKVSRPPLTLWLIAAGFRLLGVDEMGGRLPVALASLLALLACFYAADALLRRRGAWLGTLVLLTLPAFFLGARQLSSQVAPILATSLAVGGLARTAWPREPARIVPRILHLLVGIAGLALAHYACGFDLGVLAPLLALALALVFAGGPSRLAVIASAVALAALAVVVQALMREATPGHPIGYSPLLGGVPRKALWSIHLTTPLKQIGFGAYPWSALLPLAAAWALIRRDATLAPADADDEGRLRLSRFFLLAWAIFAYLLTVLHFASVGETMYPAFVALALLAGDTLDRALADERRFVYAGFIIIIGAVILGHDVFMQPESLAGAHLVEALKWSGPLGVVPYALLGIGLFWGLTMALGLAALPAAQPWRGREAFFLGALALTLGQTFYVTYSIVPGLSRHLSAKNLFSKFRQLGGTNAPIGQYHVPGRGAAYYSQGKSTELASLTQVFEFLAKRERAFVIAAADDLAAIDQFAKSHPQATASGETKPASYYVVDDSNARFLLLSNQLGPQETDLNPLRRFVVDRLPRQPQHPVSADFEGKVELLGYDLPAEIQRGSKFKITLYYKVNAPIAGGYKVFIHFDGSNRFNGDHVPLGGKFPTSYWYPGFYIIDEHVMEADRMNTSSASYQIFTGFWIGERRLKVVSGPSDGENRVKLGTVRVR